MPKNPARPDASSTAPWTISIAYAALFAGQGVHMPFFPIWLSSVGLDSAQIGLVLALPLLQRALTLPLMTGLAGAAGDLKRAIALYAGLTAAGLLLYPGSAALWWIVAVTLAVSLTWMPLAPVLDALAVTRARADGFDYGRVRVWGSVTFVALAFGSGVVVDRFGPSIVISMIAACFAALSIAALALPRDAVARGDAARGGMREGWRLLLAQPGLPPLLLGCGLLQASHAVVYAFGSLHWKSLGHTETTIGAIWAASVVAEILFFLVSGRWLARVGIPGLLAAASASAILRWGMMASDPGLPLTFAAQGLHALTFAATHVATVNLLGGALPPRFAALAQGAYSTLLGAVNGAAFLAAGPLYGALQGRSFAVMALVAVLASGLVVAGLAARRGQPQSAGEGGKTRDPS